MPNIALSLVLLIALSVPSGSSAQFFSQGESDPQDPAQPSQAEVLLDRGYDLIIHGKISDVDRIRALSELVILAPDILGAKKVKDRANKLREWADDPTTKGLSEWDRMAFRKNSIVAIGKVDSDSAMTLLDHLGPAPADEQQQRPEDVRAFGARTVFLQYFRDRGMQSVEQIQNVAEHLSKGGAYPFFAVSLVIGELTGKGKEAADAANKLFESALDHYPPCPPKVDNQELEFFALLQSAKPVVSAPTLVKAVKEFADHLTNSKCDSGSKSMIYAALIETSDNKKIKIPDSRKALLFQAYSLIVAVDKDDKGLDSRLKAYLPELAFANAPIDHVWSTYYPPQASEAEQQDAEKSGLQKSLTQGIGRVRESNPEAALEMANSISDKNKEDKDVKTTQIASILPALAKKDLPRSKQLYTATLNDLSSLDEGSNKTWATLWMAEAAYNAEDFNNFRYFATKTFADGVKSLDGASGDDQTPVDLRSGYKQLNEFVRFSSAHGISWPLDNVEDLSNDALKARLFISAAKGLSHS